MKTDIIDNDAMTGKVSVPQEQRPGEKEGCSGISRPDEEEVAAAIAAALSIHFGNNVHDTESYVITIRRKKRERDVCYMD